MPKPPTRMRAIKERHVSFLMEMGKGELAASTFDVPFILAVRGDEQETESCKAAEETNVVSGCDDSGSLRCESLGRRRYM